MCLDIHLHGERIGTLFPAGENDYRLAYDPDLLKRVEPGTQLLSNVLPVRREPFGAEASRSYVEGLLPEGRRREQMADELGIDPADGYALLAEIGRDCAGAAVFLPEGTPLESDPDSIAWLSEEDLEELVCFSPKRPIFDPSNPQRMRAALAGTNHKLALVREGPKGRWGWPQAGIPSTHVVKPESRAFPGLVANEMFCMTVARRVGARVAKTRVETIAGRPCLVSRRFDRSGEGTGAIRLHQEDFCQALGFPPGGAEQLGGEGEEGEQDIEADGPGFPQSCGLLRALDRIEDVPDLLIAAVCNYALGNGDAHGKNFALLFTEEGPRLAPHYDITSTLVYDFPTHTGMVISEDYDETAYLLELGWIADECQLPFDPLRYHAAGTATKVGEVLEKVAAQAHREGWYAPVVDEIVELAAERAENLVFEVEY